MNEKSNTMNTKNITKTRYDKPRRRNDAEVFLSSWRLCDLAVNKRYHSFCWFIKRRQELRTLTGCGRLTFQRPTKEVLEASNRKQTIPLLTTSGVCNLRRITNEFHRSFFNKQQRRKAISFLLAALRLGDE